MAIHPNGLEAIMRFSQLFEQEKKEEEGGRGEGDKRTAALSSGGRKGGFHDYAIRMRNCQRHDRLSGVFFLF